MSPSLPDYIRAAVANPLRPERDTARDAGRKPGETMAFFGIQPAQRVAEVNAGWGYFVRVLAGVVGEAGKVYAHSTEASNRRWGGNPIEKFVAKTGVGNIETVLGTMDEPNLPADLDAVFQVMSYHDAVWSGANRPKMLAAIRAALKPGGIYGVIDHHARPGRGLEDCHEIHRIEKQAVVEEVTAAGFVLEAESDLLANPDDPCTAQVHGKDIRDRTHRFMLKFRKPA